MYLDRVDLFAGLEPGWLDSMGAAARVRGYAAGQIVVHEGDEANALYVVQQGCLKAFLTDEQGREIALSLMGPGDFFGELALLDGAPRSASVVAVERSDVLHVPRAVFQSLWDGHEAFRRVIVTNLVTQVRTLTENVRAMALVDVFGRMVRLFQSLAVEQDGAMVIAQRLTQQDIANFVGASREMVNRILRDLVVGGYIAIENHQIRLLKKLPTRW